MDEDDDLCVQHMTFSTPPKRSTLDLDLETDRSIETRGDEENTQSNSNTEKEACSCTFQPICITGEWEDLREEQRVSVAVCMPSDLFDPGRVRDNDLRVIDNGSALEITVVWP